jgi:hypothetical protein
MKIDNIKEEVTHNKQNVRKKKETQNKLNAIPAEDRISEFEDEIVIKGKTEELLVKQLRTCERNMQELIDSIRRPNLRIMGIDEG